MAITRIINNIDIYCIFNDVNIIMLANANPLNCSEGEIFNAISAVIKRTIGIHTVQMSMFPIVIAFIIETVNGICNKITIGNL